MPLDAITISALCDELRPQLEGARIDKVQQPERDAVLLSVRSLGRNRRLLIAALPRARSLCLSLSGAARTSSLSAPTGASSTVCAVWILPETRSAA